MKGEKSIPRGEEEEKRNGESSKTALHNFNFRLKYLTKRQHFWCYLGCLKDNEKPIARTQL